MFCHLQFFKEIPVEIKLIILCLIQLCYPIKEISILMGKVK